MANPVPLIFTCIRLHSCWNERFFDSVLAVCTDRVLSHAGLAAGQDAAHCDRSHLRRRRDHSGKNVPPKTIAATYDAALDRWPRNLAARIGLGNAAYARGDVQHAEKAYRQAALDHPESAIAFNNLAQALDAAHRAVSLV